MRLIILLISMLLLSCNRDKAVNSVVAMESGNEKPSSKPALLVHVNFKKLMTAGPLRRSLTEFSGFESSSLILQPVNGNMKASLTLQTTDKNAVKILERLCDEDKDCYHFSEAFLNKEKLVGTLLDEYRIYHDKGLLAFCPPGVSFADVAELHRFQSSDAYASLQVNDFADQKWGELTEFLLSDSLVGNTVSFSLLMLPLVNHLTDKGSQPLRFDWGMRDDLEFVRLSYSGSQKQEFIEGIKTLTENHLPLSDKLIIFDYYCLRHIRSSLKLTEDRSTVIAEAEITPDKRLKFFSGLSHFYAYSTLERIGEGLANDDPFKERTLPIFVKEIISVDTGWDKKEAIESLQNYLSRSLFYPKPQKVRQVSMRCQYRPKSIPNARFQSLKFCIFAVQDNKGHYLKIDDEKFTYTDGQSSRRIIDLNFPHPIHAEHVKKVKIHVRGEFVSRVKSTTIEDVKPGDVFETENFRFLILNNYRLYNLHKGNSSKKLKYIFTAKDIDGNSLKVFDKNIPGAVHSLTLHVPEKIYKISEVLTVPLLPENSKPEPETLDSDKKWFIPSDSEFKAYKNITEEEVSKLKAAISDRVNGSLGIEGLNDDFNGSSEWLIISSSDQEKSSCSHRISKGFSVSPFAAVEENTSAFGKVKITIYSDHQRIIVNRKYGLSQKVDNIFVHFNENMISTDVPDDYHIVSVRGFCRDGKVLNSGKALQSVEIYYARKIYKVTVPAAINVKEELQPALRKEIAEIEDKQKNLQLLTKEEKHWQELLNMAKPPMVKKEKEMRAAYKVYIDYWNEISNTDKPFLTESESAIYKKLFAIYKKFSDQFELLKENYESLQKKTSDIESKIRDLKSSIPYRRIERDWR